MKHVEPHQLWVAPDSTFYYVDSVRTGTATVIPVRIVGMGRKANVVRLSELPTRDVPIDEMLSSWVLPVAEDS